MNRAYKEKLENLMDQKMQRIDLLNLQYAELYQFDAEHKYKNVEYEKEFIEAPNAEQALDATKELLNKRGWNADNFQISIYEWIPETLEEEGVWELVDPYEQKTVEDVTKDLESIESKTISKTEIQKDGQLRITFTDGKFIIIGIDPFKQKLDWYVTPF